MPQFDTFSFLSQLFWVFLSFLFFYLLVCFYLLPAIAAILKTRKRKLAQISSNIDSVSLVNTEFLQQIKSSLDRVSIKLEALAFSNNASVGFNISKNLDAFSVKSEAFREFNVQVFTKAQITYLLYT